MSSSDWYRRQMGGAQAPSAPPSIQRSYTPNLPPTYQPQPVLPAFSPDNFYEDGEPVHKPERVGDAILLTRPGQKWQQGNNTETARCPSCGGNNYFSRREGSKITQQGTVQPAPHCWDCGHNGGLYRMFGGDDHG